MGSLTPNPNIKHTNIKLTSKGDINVFAMLEKVESPVIKKRYNRAKIRNSAPN
jgi:hypothetical protein